MQIDAFFLGATLSARRAIPDLASRPNPQAGELPRTAALSDGRALNSNDCWIVPIETRLAHLEYTLLHRELPTQSRAIRRVWRDVRTLNLASAREGLEAVERKLSFDEHDQAGENRFDFFAVRAMTLALEDDTLSASAAAEHALQGNGSETFARLARLVRCFCAWKAGSAPPTNCSAALSALQALSSSPPASPNELFADVLDLTMAACIEFSQLRLPNAERLARCALRRAEFAPATSVKPASALGRILYAQGLVEETEQLLTPRRALIRNFASLDSAADAYCALAGASAYGGDFAAAHATLDEAGELAEARNWPRLQAAMLAERICIGGPESERRVGPWLQRLHNLADRNRQQARCARSEIACHLARAQIQAYLKFGVGALPLAALAQLRRDATLGRDLQAAAWVKLAETQVLWSAGEEDSAAYSLVDVLRIAEAAGLRQHLRDAGLRLRPIIERALQDRLIDQQLLAFAICLLDDLDRPAAGKKQRTRHLGRRGEGLTIRECDVLKLIGEGCTNKGIAQRLGVTPETIKTHVKNIFLKLGVERRAQATAKAERLGIL